MRDVGKLCGKKAELKIIFDTIVRQQRPQTLETNYELVKKDVDQLVSKKGKFGSKDKTMVATMLAKNSWAHIKQVCDTFGTYSEKAFSFFTVLYFVCHLFWFLIFLFICNELDLKQF